MLSGDSKTAEVIFGMPGSMFKRNDKSRLYKMHVMNLWFDQNQKYLPDSSLNPIYSLFAIIISEGPGLVEVNSELSQGFTEVLEDVSTEQQS